MEMKSRIQEKFKLLYGTDGDMFASAGRINLIGEHTDYNGVMYSRAPSTRASSSKSSSTEQTRFTHIPSIMMSM